MSGGASGLSLQRFESLERELSLGPSMAARTQLNR